MTSIAQAISRAASWYGPAVAVSDGVRALTFRDVEERSNRCANALLGLSGDRSGRVALLTPNRVESVELDFGIAKAGKVRVPVNTRLGTAEREHILNDSGVETLLYDASMADFVAEVRDRVGVREYIAIGSAVAGSHSYDDVLAAAAATPPVIELAADDPSFILYTSGTTGRPKGATATQASRWAATIAMLTDELDVAAGDAMVHVASMAHGSGSKVLAYFMRGGRNIAVGRWDPEDFLRMAARERATGSFLVPTMISALIEAARGLDVDTSSWKSLSYGGAPIAPAVLQAALERFGPVFVQVYGSCEAPHPVTVLRPSEHRPGPDQERRLASVGREVPNCMVRLVGRDGVDVATGQPGEMWISGPNVMRGYWGNAEATDAVFADGWYRSGDIATRDEEGFVTIVDRDRDMVISGGLNVYPAEVEATLYEHPAVLECAVFGAPDERWGEVVVAAVVARPGVAVTAVDLVDHCRTRLAGYKKPQLVVFHDELPKGATGKILKRTLREPYWEGRARAV
jgi:acyl-CoA synthetase (AMP-forming)/AMP-acid ligase II